MSDQKVVIHWNKVLLKQPENYLAWPTIGQTRSGEILVVFSGDRETHVCPYGKNQLIRSSDGGDTWSDPETVNNSPLDDRDTGMVVMRSGTLLITWFTGISYSSDRYRDMYPNEYKSWLRHWKKISQHDRSKYHGRWSRRSTDGGANWEPQVDTIVSAPHGPIQLKDGRLMMVGNARIDGRPTVASVESRDEGRSWQLSGVIPIPEEKLADAGYFNEPHLVELPDGKIVALIRYEPTKERYSEWYMHQSESLDGGKTWTSAHQTPIWGYPPHLIRLSSGPLLVTYGLRREPFGERACLSYDGGITWDIENEIVLRDDAPSGDLGYPATVELEPGELLTVYYQLESESDRVTQKLESGVESPEELVDPDMSHIKDIASNDGNGKTCIMATRWSIK